MITRTLAVLLALTVPASADTLFITLQGQVTDLGPTPGFWDSSVTVGQTYTSTFTIGTSAIDENGSPTSGEFRDYTGQSTLVIGNYSFLYENSFAQIVNSGFDQYNFAPSGIPTGNIQSGVRNSQFTGQLTFNVNTALDSDQMPVVFFPLGQFNSPMFYFDGEDPASDVDDPDEFSFQATITSFSVTVVPEPGTASLAALSAAAWIAARRCRRPLAA